MKNFSRSSTGIDLNLLPVFIEVVRCGNMAKASLRLNMSRPAVSLALKRFGLQFDEPLFTRRGLFLEPTAEALRLTTELEKLLGLIHDNLAGEVATEDGVPTSETAERLSVMPAASRA
jgi:DNA-binding transcriptional LysR family regulator